jgi:hypothetical protein
MAAIQEHRELNSSGTSERGDRIHGSPAGAAGIKNVVYEDDSEFFQMKRQTRFADTCESISNTQIVPVHRNIDRAQVGLPPLDSLNQTSQAPR